MSNEDSRNIPDTRGRPRDEELDRMVEQIELAFMNDALPITYFGLAMSETPKRRAKRLRASTSFRELEEEHALRFRLLPRKNRLVVCLGKHLRRTE